MYYNYGNYGNNVPYNNFNYQGVQQPIQTMQTNQQIYKPQNALSLQGKVVDSLEVVKATDIPYDGSISYFPLTDASAIITKQLQQDGTSKVIIYKPISENEIEKAKTNYITENDFKDYIKNIEDRYITESDLKDQIKSINNKDIKDMKEDIKTLKRKLEDVIDDLKDKKEK